MDRARRGTTFTPASGGRWHVATGQHVTHPDEYRPFGRGRTLCGITTGGTFGKGGKITCGRCRRLVKIREREK